MQGLLRNAPLATEITTTCAHCQERMRLSIESTLSWRILEGGSNPLVFEPELDWATFADPNIIDGY